MPDEEEMVTLNLPHQPQPAAVVDEQPLAPPSVAAPGAASDAELADWDAVLSQGFNHEKRSGEPECSTAAAPAQGPGARSGGSHASPGDGKKWDIFLSYRVSTDQDLVKELYWLLCHRTVSDSGKERKLRVFWDRECLKTGERWEEGFADAICSCHLVVLVMSRTALVMDGSHNVTTLVENSRCDNLLLEYSLALELNKLKSTSILPLFVGDKDGSGQYKHFFQTDCLPKLQEDVVVRLISEKVEGYLEQNAGISREQMPKRQSIRDVIDSVTQFQGHILQGNAYESVKGAAQSIFECTVRLVQERRERRAVETFKFSTPQGQEVYEWLAENRLLPFACIFAQNKLNSLRKVSHLTHKEVVEINIELYARQKREDDALVQQHGTRVALGDAIDRLKRDPRTKTIQEQMEGYKDSKVSTVNLLGAQNQVSAFIKKKHWVYLWTLVWLFFTVWNWWYFVDLMQELSYTTQNPPMGSVMTYGVQVRNDTTQWRYVLCKDNHGDPCVFDSRITATGAQAGSLLPLFPRQEEARFVKILPYTWIGMHNSNTGRRGADMRLGIIGVSDRGTLDYRVLSDGTSRMGWLQKGCVLNMTSGPEITAGGRWSSLDEAVGEVQCCVNAKRVHVCTRDGCLSGDREATKYTWRDAKARCEERGWRLCRREELNRPGSAGCCSGNRCGYNEELVWTSNVGGLLQDNTQGRIGGDVAFESVTEVTLDLGEVQIVRGVQVQNGVQEIAYNGPSCIVAYGASVWVCIPFFACLIVPIFSRCRPSVAGGRLITAAYCGLALASSVSLCVLAVDTAIPSLFSQNPICPSSSILTKSIFDASTLHITMLPWSLSLVVGQYVCPHRQIMVVLVGLISFLSVWWVLGGYYVWAASIFILGPFIWFSLMLLQNVAKRSAEKATARDIRKYESRWRTEKSSDVAGDLEVIKKQCETVKTDIRKAKIEVVSLWRPKDATPFSFKASDFSLVSRFAFYIRAGGLGRYGRTHKACQITANADMLFEEAAVLNEDFFNFLESNIDVGKLCRGPVKRPDRAFQKVARKYYYDARHLTDLVRCCVVCESISDVRRVLDQICELSIIFGEEAAGNPDRNDTKDEDEKPLLGGGGDGNSKPNTLGEKWKNAGAVKPGGGRELSNSRLAAALARKKEFTADEWAEFGIRDLGEEDFIKSGSSYFKPVTKVFKLCKIKDDFTRDGLGFRFICLNLEVGWTIESESGEELQFVTVQHFNNQHVRTHICEVQILLKSTYDLKIGGCHDNFVKARNMLAK